MGKRRIHNKHLPQRVYFKHGAYYHVSTDGKWTRLGTTESQMFRALSDRVAEDYPKERLTSVYVMKLTGPDLPRSVCKIGRSTNPERRVIQLQCHYGEHYQIKMHCYFVCRFAESLEPDCHHELRAKRLYGELFAISAVEAEKTIARLARQYPFPITRHQ